MSLWLDKYRPRDLSKLDYHREQATNLKKLVKQGDFPHLLVYGPSGSGKKTRIMCLLKELYGPGVEKLRTDQMQFTTASNKKMEITTLSSNYHVEMNPQDVGIYDRIVVMDLIKNMAQFQQLDTNGQRDFKVVVLTDVNHLTRDAQHALRRTMEKYIQNCRLILCANSTSNITPAIKSRCLGIRVPAPTQDDIVMILHKVCKKESLYLPDELAKRVAQQCDRNLRRALLMLEGAKSERYPFDELQVIREPDWLTHIKRIAVMLLKSQEPAQITKIRSDFYELLTHNIPAPLIFKVLLQEILLKCDLKLQSQVVAEAAYYEHRMHSGSKEIFHLEAFIIMFMQLYKSFLEESLGGMF